MAVRRHFLFTPTKRAELKCDGKKERERERGIKTKEGAETEREKIEGVEKEKGQKVCVRERERQNTI